jgi:hypothetical protein
MKTFYAFVLLIFIGLLYIGCSDKSITPVEAIGVDKNNVVLQKVDGPGAWLVRYEATGWYYVFFDEERELLLTLGLNNIADGCAGAGGYDVYSIKDIFLPNADPDLRRIVTQEKATLTAMVWQTSVWPGWDYLCDFMLSNDPLATGLANYIYNDNDYLAWAQPNNNSNSFGYKANGTLLGQDGTSYKLNFIYRLVWDGDLTNRNMVFKIQLTPTGH